MPDMDAAGRIGEHLEHVIFRARIVVFGRKDRLFVPLALPARFGFACVVAFGGHEIAGYLGICSRLWEGGLGHKSAKGVNAPAPSKSAAGPLARERHLAIRHPPETVFYHRVSAAVLGGVEGGIGSL